MRHSSAPILPPRNPRRHPVYDRSEEQPRPPPLPPKPKSNKTARNSPLNRSNTNYYTGSNGSQRRPASCPLQTENADERQTPNRKSSRSTSRSKRRHRRTPTDGLLMGNRYQVGVSPTPQVLRSETRSPASPLFCPEEERQVVITPPPRRTTQSSSFTCRYSHQHATGDIPLDNHATDDGARSYDHDHNSNPSSLWPELESPNSCFNMDPSTIACGEAFTHTKQVASSGLRAKLSKLKHLFTRVPHHKHHQVGSTPPPPIRRAFSAHRKRNTDLLTKDDRQTATPRLYSPHHNNQPESAKFSPVHLRTSSVPTTPANAHQINTLDSAHRTTNNTPNRNQEATCHSRTLSPQLQSVSVVTNNNASSLTGAQARRPHSSRGRSGSRNRSQTKTPEDDIKPRHDTPPTIHRTTNLICNESVAMVQRPRPQMHHHQPTRSRQSPGRLDGVDSIDQSVNMTNARHTSDDSSTTTARYPANQSRRENRKMATFLENIGVLQKMGYYWGSITFEEAEMLLKERKDGTFLVRDSSHEFYFLTLSFRAFSLTFHTRVEYSAGQFGFQSLPGIKAVTIVEFIRQAVERCQNGNFHYFLRTTVGDPNDLPINPADPTNSGVIPVSILYPLSRFTVVTSLQQLCRANILRHVRRDLIDKLYLPPPVKQYLLEKPYSLEWLTQFCELTKDMQPLTLATTLPNQFQSMNL